MKGVAGGGGGVERGGGQGETFGTGGVERLGGLASSSVAGFEESALEREGGVEESKGS